MSLNFKKGFSLGFLITFFFTIFYIFLVSFFHEATRILVLSAISAFVMFTTTRKYKGNSVGFKYLTGYTFAMLISSFFAFFIYRAVGGDLDSVFRYLVPPVAISASLPIYLYFIHNIFFSNRPVGMGQN